MWQKLRGAQAVKPVMISRGTKEALGGMGEGKVTIYIGLICKVRCRITCIKFVGGLALQLYFYFIIYSLYTTQRFINSYSIQDF